MTVRRNKIALDEVKKVVQYNPYTGLFFWIIKRNGVLKTGIAGHSSKYVRIKINGVSYSASCLAWLWMTGIWPEHEIDHRDLNKHNNAWDNLRAATRAQNMQNAPCWKKGKLSKYKGIHWKKDCSKWEAKIGLGGHQKYLGRFDSEQEAHAAYVQAATKYFGEFARTK